jgi:hypothetical protein
METDVWGPPWVVRIKEEYEGVMGAGERSIKMTILLTRIDYSVLKQEIKDDEGCEWSK